MCLIFQEYENFILVMNEAVKGKPLALSSSNSDVILGLVTLLDTVDKWIEEIPPLSQAQRFGNQAFRTWHARLKEVTVIQFQDTNIEKQ